MRRLVFGRYPTLLASFEVLFRPGMCLLHGCANAQKYHPAKSMATEMTSPMSLLLPPQQEPHP